MGPRHDKVRSLPPYTNPSLVSRMTLCHSTTPSPCGPALLRPHQQPIPCSGYLQLLPQPPCHIPPATAHPNTTFALRPPCGLPPTAGVPSAAGHLNSPTAGKMPPGYDSVLQTECGIRNMQDLLLEGDVTYDLDGFTPSLTDLQLQGMTAVKKSERSDDWFPFFVLILLWSLRISESCLGTGLLKLQVMNMC